MADTKTTALPENTTPVTTDIMMIVDDPGGSAASQKITLINMATLINSLSGRVLISEQTPTGTGTVTWSSIPATYKSLEIEYVVRGTQIAAGTTMYSYLNNDTTAGNYRRTIIQGYEESTLNSGSGDDAIISVVSAASSPANSCGAGFIKIIQYAGTTFKKQVICNFSYQRDSTLKQYAGYTTMEWENAGAINRVDLVLSAGNYDTGSTFRLYGVF